PPIDRTGPISTWVHCWVVRWTATNGRNPVCTSARKKMNQSSPRKLCCEGVGRSNVVGSGDGDGRTGSPSRLVGSLRCLSIGSVCCLDERTNGLLLQIFTG